MGVNICMTLVALCLSLKVEWSAGVRAKICFKAETGWFTCMVYCVLYFELGSYMTGLFACQEATDRVAGRVESGGFQISRVESGLVTIVLMITCRVGSAT